MENITNNNQDNRVEVKSHWFTAYFFAGVIYYGGQNFVKTSADGLIVLVIAIWSGWYYSRLKRRIKIKNDFLRSLCSMGLIFIVSALSIGFLTALL